MTHTCFNVAGNTNYMCVRMCWGLPEHSFIFTREQPGHLWRTRSCRGVWHTKSCRRVYGRACVRVSRNVTISYKNKTHRRNSITRSSFRIQFKKQSKDHSERMCRESDVRAELTCDGQETWQAMRELVRTLLYKDEGKRITHTLHIQS